MKERSCACLRYCPQLGRNVIMESKYTDGRIKLECLNKAECNYCEKGCRNLLLPDYGKMSAMAGAEAGMAH